LGKYSLGWISPESILRANAATISRWTRGFRFLEPLSAIGASVFILGPPATDAGCDGGLRSGFSPDCCPFLTIVYESENYII
jgi:hypothetical protein